MFKIPFVRHFRWVTLLHQVHRQRNVAQVAVELSLDPVLPVKCHPENSDPDIRHHLDLDIFRSAIQMSVQRIRTQSPTGILMTLT